MGNGQVFVLSVATGLYVLQAVLGLTRLHRSGRAGAAERWGPLLAALLLHTGFLVGRAIEARGLPFQTRLDSVALFLWVTAVVFLAGSRPYRLDKVAPLFWTLFAVGGLAMWAFASRERIPGASCRSTSAMPGSPWGPEWRQPISFRSSS
jgi:ABC-type transport system involved in cytochrome c biogenesis permease subunit